MEGGHRHQAQSQLHLAAPHTLDCCMCEQVMVSPQLPVQMAFCVRVLKRNLFQPPLENAYTLYGRLRKTNIPHTCSRTGNVLVSTLNPFVPQANDDDNRSHAEEDDEKAKCSEKSANSQGIVAGALVSG